MLEISAVSATPCRAMSRALAAVSTASWVVLRALCTNPTWRSAPSATVEDVRAISSIAWPVCCELAVICCELAATRPASAPMSSIIPPTRSFRRARMAS